MPDKKFELGDYVEVKDRIALFYELYGQGRLVTKSVKILTAPDGTQRVIVKALAYRTVDDPLPGTGTSWLELPGKTPYTKGSEVENAETSAWGRAIGALGILIDRSIATSNEIENKRDTKAEAGPAVAAKGWIIESETSLGSWEGHGLAGLNDVAGMDGQLRIEPEHGHKLGFVLALDAKKRIPQVIALGDLAVDIADATIDQAKYFDGREVWLTGELFEVAARKDGSPRHYQKLLIARIQTDDFTLPVPSLVVEGQEELALT